MASKTSAPKIKRQNISINGPKKRTVQSRPRLTVIGKIHEQAMYGIQSATDVKACSLSGDGAYALIDLGLAFLERVPQFDGFNPTTSGEEVAQVLEALATHVRHHPDVIGSALQSGAMPIYNLLLSDAIRIGVHSDEVPDEA